MRDPVRVTSIRTFTCDTGQGRRFVFVALDTDVGITGFGEASQSDQDAAVVANIRQLALAYEGRDVFEMIESGSELYRSDRSGRAMMVAASGIEIALWDVIGKVLDVPVYQLLGGSCHDTLRCYATVAAGLPDHQPSTIAGVAGDLLDRGFTAIKIVPFAGSPAGDRALGRDGNRAAKHAIERIAAVRDAIGDRPDLMIECEFRFDRRTATTVARALEPYGCFWLEAPLWWDDPQELARLRDAVPQRLASGELMHGRRAYRGLFEAGAVDVVQPDVKWTGGIFEAKKIAAWAEAYQVWVAPHNNSGPVATAASAHLAMTLPNALVVEVPALRPVWEQDLVGDSFPVEQGAITAQRLAARPGIGVDFDEEVAAANSVAP